MIRAKTASVTMWAADFTREMTSGPALSFEDIQARLEAKGAKGAGKAERGAKAPKVLKVEKAKESPVSEERKADKAASSWGRPSISTIRK